MDDVLYHSALRDTWEQAIAAGRYLPDSVEYVLCTDSEHYCAVANLLFRAHDDVVLLFIDSSKLQVPLRSATFNDHPVVYIDAALSVTAVFEVAELTRDATASLMAHHETHALASHAKHSLADICKRVHTVLGAWSQPWWVAGGWAIDLFLGRKTRPHADVEIAVLAADQAALYDYLKEWDVWIAGDGVLRPWQGQSSIAPYHQIWAKQSSTPTTTPTAFSADPTMLDFLIEDHQDTVWYYRRDQRITRALDQFGAVYKGIPFVRPEIALLFKSKQPRFKDQRDFAQVLPLLDESARRWLHAALQGVYPAHEWCTYLM